MPLSAFNVFELGKAGLDSVMLARRVRLPSQFSRLNSVALEISRHEQDLTEMLAEGAGLQQDRQRQDYLANNIGKRLVELLVSVGTTRAVAEVMVDRLIHSINSECRRIKRSGADRRQRGRYLYLSLRHVLLTRLEDAMPARTFGVRKNRVGVIVSLRSAFEMHAKSSIAMLVGQYARSGDSSAEFQQLMSRIEARISCASGLSSKAVRQLLVTATSRTADSAAEWSGCGEELIDRAAILCFRDELLNEYHLKHGGRCAA